MEAQRRMSGASAETLSPQQAPAKRLRVLLDARKLNHGGIGVYLDNLIAGFVELNVVRERALADQAFNDHGVSILPRIDLTLVANRETTRNFWWSPEVDVIEENAKQYSLEELFLMPGRLPLKQFDLYHAAHFNLPFRLSIPSVVTIHDVIHLTHPETWYHASVAKVLMRSAIHRANRVVTVSQASYRDIIQTLNPSPEDAKKISVISNAIDPFFIGPITSPRDFLNLHNIRGPYLLVVSSMSKPHKGLSDLLDAWEAILLKRRNVSPKHGASGLEGFQDEIQLVIAGQGVRNDDDAELLNRARGMRNVHVIGSVQKVDLRRLYQGAIAVVIPSRAEGFCLPALEAHACGTRLLTRPVPAIYEQLTSYDRTCYDFTTHSLIVGIERLIEEHFRGDLNQDDALRVLPGLTAARFGRLDIAKTLLQVYLEAAGKR